MCLVLVLIDSCRLLMVLGLLVEQAYMQPLYQLTLHTIQTDQEDVALNAMEFWSSLCDEEVSSSSCES